MSSSLPVTGNKFNRAIKTVLGIFLFLTTLSVVLVAGKIRLIKAPEVAVIGTVTDITPKVMKGSSFDRPFLLAVLRENGSYSFAQIENGLVSEERLVNETELLYQNGDSGLVKEKNDTVEVFISKKGAKETAVLIVRGVTGVTLPDGTTLPVKIINGRITRGKLTGEFELQTLATNQRILGKFDTRGKMVVVRVENALNEPDAASSLIAKEILKLQISMEGEPEGRVLAATTDTDSPTSPTIPLNSLGTVASFFQIRQNQPDGSLTIDTQSSPGFPATGLTLAGPAGPQGDKGDKGDKGDQGIAGALGPSGAAGATGADGATGPAGADGTSGSEADTLASVTGRGASTSSLLTLSGGLNVSGGTVTIPAGQIDNSELANSSLTVTAGTGLSGGGTVSLGGTTTLSLPSVGTASTYGSALNIPVFTTDAQGRVTAVTNTAISGLTNTNLSGSAGITNANLANSSITFGGNTGSGTISLGGTLNILGAGINNAVYSGGTVTITGTEADTLDSVAGRGATTANTLTLNGGINTTTSSINFTVGGTDSSGKVQIGNSGTATPDLLVLDNGTTDPTGVNGGTYYNTGTNKFRCYENSAWKNCDTGVQQSTIVAKTESADLTTTSTTLQNTNLSFAIGAGETWSVWYSLRSFNSTGARDVSFAVSAPTGATCYLSGGTLNQSSADETSCAPTIIEPQVGNSDELAILAVTIVNGGTTGTATLQFASTTGAVGTAHVDAGSSMKAFKNQGSDLAEIYYTTDDTIGPGSVVTIDPSIKAGVKGAIRPYDPQVLGVLSTLPGMVLGDSLFPPGTRPVYLALSGRVPVKVSTENGKITAGDYLTASSLPGIAMKATKAGLIIGQALEDFSQGSDVGLVMAFVKTQYFTGEKVYSADGSEKLVGMKLLENLTATTNVTSEIDLSEINSDRVIAGLELVTPKVITQDILATGMFVMQDKEGNENVKITSDGNAIFMGTIKADKIIANEIQGFKLMADSITTLSNKVAGIATQSGDLQGQSSQAGTSGADVNLQRLSLDIKDMVNNIFRRVAEFFGKVIFHNDVAFLGRPTFNKDTAGFAIIKGDSNEVEIKFEKEYATEPVVNISLHIAGAIDMNNLPTYAVAGVDTKGFKIRLSKVTGMDLRFSWMAIAVSDATSTTSVGNSVVIPSDPAPTPTPEVTSTPTVVITPTPTQEASGSAIVTPSPTATLEVTPDLEASGSAVVE